MKVSGEEVIDVKRTGLNAGFTRCHRCNEPTAQYPVRVTLGGGDKFSHDVYYDPECWDRELFSYERGTSRGLGVGMSRDDREAHQLAQHGLDLDDALAERAAAKRAKLSRKATWEEAW